MEAALSIMICTYKRRERLAKLLQCLADQVGACKFEVIVVDNDVNCSAKNVCEQFSDKQLLYKVVDEPNISLARNAALDLAQTKYGLFLDDDQLVERDFVAKLMNRVNLSNRGDIFCLDKRPAFAEKTKLEALFHWPDGADHSDLSRSQMGTGGLLINLEAAGSLRFDERLGRSGGEDIDYYLRGKAQGLCFVWLKEPHVVEFIPREKMRTKTILRQSFRKGNCDVMIDRLHGLHNPVFSCLKIVVATGIGLVVAAFGLTNRTNLVKSLSLIARQAGKVWGVSGNLFAAYDQVDKTGVLHVTYDINLGGCEKLLEQLADSVDERSDKVTMVFFMYDRLRPKGIAAQMLRKGHRVIGYKKSGSFGVDLQLLFKLSRTLRLNKCGIYHSHDQGALVYGLLLKFLNPRLRLFHTEHTLHYWRESRRRRLVYRVASLFYDKIIAVSGFVKKYLKEIGIAEPKIAVIRNGVVFSPAKRPSLKSNSDQLRLVSVQRISTEKNLIHTINELAIAREKGLDFDYTIVGSGDQILKGELEELVRQKNLTEVVTFAGYQNNVAAILETHDVFISSSREECHPIAVLEALGAGLYCSISSIEPHLEINNPLVSYHSFEPGDLVRDLIFIANKRSLDAGERLLGEQAAREEFGMAKTTASYLQTYGLEGAR